MDDKIWCDNVEYVLMVGTIKGREFLDLLSDDQLLKNSCVYVVGMWTCWELLGNFLKHATTGK